MNERTTLQTDLNVFAGFQRKLPASYCAQPYLLLGNIQPELQRSVLGQMKGLRLVGGDTMNYWIADHRPALLKTIHDWDFLLINDGEARMLSGENNLRRAAAKIMDMGPKTLGTRRAEAVTSAPRRSAAPASMAPSWAASAARSSAWIVSAHSRVRTSTRASRSSGTSRSFEAHLGFEIHPARIRAGLRSVGRDRRPGHGLRKSFGLDFVLRRCRGASGYCAPHRRFAKT